MDNRMKKISTCREMEIPASVFAIRKFMFRFFRKPLHCREKAKSFLMSEVMVSYILNTSHRGFVAKFKIDCAICFNMVRYYKF